MASIHIISNFICDSMTCHVLWRNISNGRIRWNYHCISWFKHSLIHSNQRSPQGQVFTEVYQCFSYCKFSIIHGSIQKRTEARDLKTSWKMARFKGQNKFIFKQFIQDFQYLYTQSISTKNYIYIIGVLCVSSVIKIEDLSLEYDCILELGWFSARLVT